MNKGFTLIELLAVIVILAIIALIATPIIINIINDSQEQSIKSSANLYVDGLSKYIVSRNMLGEFNPASCIITNGNISCDGTLLDYTVDGDKPTSGTITFNNGIVTGYTLGISGYTVTKSGNNITIAKGEPATTHAAYTVGQLVQYDPVNNSACTTGATCYNWNVISVNDTTANSTITVQMGSNIAEGLRGISKTDYNDDTNYDVYGNTNKGPITLLKALETATTTWDNSLKINYSYDTSGAENNYGTLSCVNGACTVANNQITSNLKARLITGEEVRDIIIAAGAEEGTIAYNWSQSSHVMDEEYIFYSLGMGNDYFLGTNDIYDPEDEYQHGISTADTALSWLSDSDIYYWTLSPASDDHNRAWNVVSGSFSWQDAGLDCCGIRPVITIPKSILE